MNTSQSFEHSSPKQAKERSMLRLVLPVVGVALFVFVLLLLINHRTIPIADITSDPDRYAGQEVDIAGEVTEAHRMFRSVFRVADETGDILILSKDVCPDVGRRVRVRGMVKPLFRISWLGIRATVIEANSIE